MSRAGRLALIRGVTAISPVTVAIFAGPIRGVIEENPTITSITSIESWSRKLIITRNMS